MKKTLIVSLLALVAGIMTTQARDRDGSITLRDGRSVVRISIGDEDRNERVMVRRIRRLEEAVRDLQDTVYDLQTQTPVENKYVCGVKTCRHSTSIHNAGLRSCDFFGMWKNEIVEVWSYSGSEAERTAIQRLKTDKDVAFTQNTPNCRLK